MLSESVLSKLTHLGLWLQPRPRIVHSLKTSSIVIFPSLTHLTFDEDFSGVPNLYEDVGSTVKFATPSLKTFILWDASLMRLVRLPRGLMTLSLEYCVEHLPTKNLIPLLNHTLPLTRRVIFSNRNNWVLRWPEWTTAFLRGSLPKLEELCLSHDSRTFEFGSMIPSGVRFENVRNLSVSWFRPPTDDTLLRCFPSLKELELEIPEETDATHFLSSMAITSADLSNNPGVASIMPPSG